MRRFGEVPRSRQKQGGEEKIELLLHRDRPQMQLAASWLALARRKSRLRARNFVKIGTQTAAVARSLLAHMSAITRSTGKKKTSAAQRHGRPASANSCREECAAQAPAPLEAARAEKELTRSIFRPGFQGDRDG